MDINKASAEDLQYAFEVDGHRAQYIINKRNELGGFESWEQIKEVVPSIEDKMVENLRAAGISIGPKHHSHGGRDESRTEHQSGSGSGSNRTAVGVRDINTVSPDELKSVCQIDGERAAYFMRARDTFGGFKSWEQIKDSVPSFDDGMVERLKKAGFTIGSESSRAA